ncbi:MAG TPA: polysaccharide ABC transporter ATP-binding protein [Clostridiales bacterium]|nr:MAG: Teichoic acids export ATP-binding protein TagH [Firmicutes bacterium ADurb.Bin262]HOU09428.1 polysaccharide ABC transporter ATP-binding protein [Clostridiales bacterium]HQH62302.1 polysaccharide ABC transporter ATP-binding protein [Clostridiales bacterium]HQK72276.1 polysaccharide ABC transporter ATP-binding protein [Clostridiales bacterium]
MAEKPTVIKTEHVGKKFIIRHKPEKKPAGRNAALPLFKKKEDFWALKDIGFEVRQGERVGIIGKNGAGKSTLLKLLCRITEPTEGRIELLGKVSAMLEVGTGFNQELTGRENVYLNGAILGMSKAEIDAKFDSIVEFSEIGQFLDTPVKRYSSGMYVRLAFAVASHLEPDILVVDEVLAVGDQRFRQKCIDKMNQIAQADTTILCVSHQMNVIRELCDRVIVLKEGRLVFDGGTEDGIRFYLNENSLSNPDFFQLDNRDRHMVSKNLVHLESLELLNNSARLAGETAEMLLRIRWTASADIKGVKLRMVIRFNDDSPVGITLSEKLCDSVKGQRYENTFSFDTSCLFPGDYKANLTLYESDETGRSTFLDHISEAIFFEVAELKNADKSVVYNHTYWGHVHLPPLVSRDSSGGSGQ